MGTRTAVRSATVAVCTFRRPERAEACLRSILERAEAASGWSLDGVLVVDNDPAGSARDAVERFAGRLPGLRYLVETEPGVSAARNRALREATGDWLFFIDDDERAGPDWPAGLMREADRSGAALVGAPVRSHYDTPPPAWVTDGGFHDRDEPPTGTHPDWLRSGNLGLDLAAVRGAELTFDPDFGRTGGEDVEFTLRARRSGLGLSWSAEGAVTETVPPDRTTAEWIVERSRHASASFHRARCAVEGRRAVVPRAALTVAIRAPQGLVEFVVGRLTGRKDREVRGRALLARARGTMEGLLGSRAPRYGVSETPEEPALR